jgi:hypothetical protein
MIYILDMTSSIVNYSARVHIARGLIPDKSQLDEKTNIICYRSRRVPFPNVTQDTPIVSGC